MGQLLKFNKENGDPRVPKSNTVNFYLSFDFIFLVNNWVPGSLFFSYSSNFSTVSKSLRPVVTLEFFTTGENKI